MRRLSPIQRPVTIDFEGQQLQAEAGEPLACTLVAEGEVLFSRSVKYHRPRGPFCLSGGCSNCLMRVDGVPNVATCQTPAKAGMRLERQNSFPDAKVDVFAANNLVFRKWFNHHEFLAGVPLVEQVMLRIARKLAGLGTLPDSAPKDVPDAVTETVPTVIVGGGASGLSAARRLTERQVPYVLFERDALLGGRLGSAAEEGLAPIFEVPEAQRRTAATVVGLYADDGRPFLASTWRGQLFVTFFERVLLAQGGQPTLLPFEDNDLPGVFAARAVARMIRRHGVVPGHRIACVGEAEEARALAKLVTSVGAEAVAVGAEPVAAHGMQRVNAVTVKTNKGEERVGCDAIALAASVSPSFELARAGGAKVSWNPRAKVFTVEADAHGRTANPSVYVAGQLRGPMSAAAATESGVLAAEAMAADVAAAAATRGGAR